MPQKDCGENLLPYRSVGSILPALLEFNNNKCLNPHVTDFCNAYKIIGYPLTPMAAQDCRILCDASNGMKWRVGLDSDNDDEKGVVNGIKNIALKEPGIEKIGVISKSVQPLNLKTIEPNP